jgi:hypothetical protein
MASINRRAFLGVVGAGSAAAAASAAVAAAGPGAASLARKPANLTFRAEAGLPARPWPAYATALVEGSVDLRSGTGVVASRIVAGPPRSQGDIGLPGTSRLVRITSATATGSEVTMRGIVEDRSTLTRGESATKVFVLNSATKQLTTELVGIQLSLAVP